MTKLDRIDPWRVALRLPGGGEARVYADDTLLAAMRRDRCLDQLARVAALPGLVGPAMAMPDAHQGYGFPIGGVAAFDPEDGGVVSPGGVGFDINCGVRLLATDVEAGPLGARGDGGPLADLAEAVLRRVPVGHGKRRTGVGRADLAGVLRDGAAWAVGRGLGEEADLARVESGGRLAGADLDAVSARARERGAGQVGTLGGGNHFIEVQRVERVLDEEAARRLGLAVDQVVVLLHTGSRGFGHQVCTDHVRELGRAAGRLGLRLPDRQLAAAPLRSPEARAYLGAMAAAANFAWANRQVITHRVREALAEVLGARARVVWDVAHNLAKMETHRVDGRVRRLCVHRKGATRAFGPGHPELPPELRDLGQPVLIPGSMGTASYVALGTETAMAETWGSVCHGAGRVRSRTAARKELSPDGVLRRLARAGVVVRGGSRRGLVEEAPEAYKDVDRVVAVVAGAGLARLVARLVPLAVVKG